MDHQGWFPTTTDKNILSCFISFLCKFTNAELSRVTAFPPPGGYVLVHMNHRVNDSCCLFPCKHFIKFT